jgi:hypothetical protein
MCNQVMPDNLARLPVTGRRVGHRRQAWLRSRASLDDKDHSHGKGTYPSQADSPVPRNILPVRLASLTARTTPQIRPDTATRPNPGPFGARSKHGR